MIETIELRWLDPVRLQEFHGEKLQGSRVPGIYLWIWQRGNGPYRIYYVGQGSDIYERQQEHVAAMLGGQYWVYKPSNDDFYEFWRRCGKDIEETKIKSTEEYLRPLAEDGIPGKMQRSEWAKQNIENSLVAWARVDPGAMEAKSQRRTIEALLNNAVQGLMRSAGIDLAHHNRHVVPGTSDTPKQGYELKHSGSQLVIDLFAGK